MEPMTTDDRLIRPDGRWTRAFVITSAFVVTSAVAWLIPDIIMAGFVGVVALSAIWLLFMERAYDAGGWGFKTFLIFTLLGSIATVIVVHLDARGREMESAGRRHLVTVTSQRDVLFLRSTRWRYTLNEGGSPIPGELIEDFDGFDPGDTIEVYTKGDKHLLASDVEFAPLVRSGGIPSFFILLPMCVALGYFAPMCRRRGPERSLA